ncbi:hypothetical protein CDEF62S_05908 [Castellaniella defragrans]
MLRKPYSRVPREGPVQSSNLQPSSVFPDALQIRCAFSFRQRLQGIRAWPDWEQGSWGLLLPRCKAVHTLGLRRPIDVVFVSRAGGVLRVCGGLAPNRWVGWWPAWGVLELPAGYCSAPGWSGCVSAAWAFLKIEV